MKIEINIDDKELIELIKNNLTVNNTPVFQDTPTGQGRKILPSGQPIKLEGVPIDVYNDNINNKLISYKEVGEYLEVSYGYLRQLVMRNQIPHYKLGRSVRFRLSEIDDWLVDKKEGRKKK